MSRPSQLRVPAIIRCPRCGYEAEAEPIQLRGDCSLICPNCGFHFYVTPKINGVAQVMEGKRVELVRILKARNTI